MLPAPVCFAVEGYGNTSTRSVRLTHRTSRATARGQVSRDQSLRRDAMFHPSYQRAEYIEVERLNAAQKLKEMLKTGVPWELQTV
jgi:hypothetical protein